MDVNFVNLYGLVTGLISAGILIYLIPKQFTELKRPHDGFTRLRRRLFRQPIIMVILIAPRILYLLTQLDTESHSTAVTIVSLFTSTLLLYFVYNMLKSYAYEENDIPDKFFKRKENKE